MSRIATLRRVALLGTERNPVEVPGAEGELGVLLGRLDPDDGEGMMLRLAAIFSCHETAGRRATPGEGTFPEPCGPEDVPECSPGAARLLKKFLEENRPRFVEEWLKLAARRGVRVRFDLLSDLLDLVKQHKRLHPLISKVIGRRGLWLATMNEDWRIVASAAGTEEDTRIWEEGHRYQRSAYLRALRGHNALRARELLAGCIEKEPARERGEFVACLEVGLSLDDEPFLESLLDDRSKEVRKAAAGLLSRLSASRLCRRMQERIASLVSLEKRLLKVVLKVNPPESTDEGLRRDMVEEAPKGPGMGEKAWRLKEIVGAVPLEWWHSTLNRTPAEWIELAKKTDWRAALVEGWAAAAQRQEDPTWAEAILDAFPTTRNFGFTTVDLVPVLPRAVRERWIAERIRASKERFRGADIPVLHFLLSLDPPWLEDLCRVVLSAMRRRVREDKTKDWELFNAFKEFALFVPDTMLDEATSGWPDTPEGWGNYEEAGGEYLLSLQLLKELHKEFSK